jgi:hypothetical protein
MTNDYTEFGYGGDYAPCPLPHQCGHCFGRAWRIRRCRSRGATGGGEGKQLSAEERPGQLLSQQNRTSSGESGQGVPELDLVGSPGAGLKRQNSGARTPAAEQLRQAVSDASTDALAYLRPGSRDGALSQTHHAVSFMQTRLVTGSPCRAQGLTAGEYKRPGYMFP